MRLALAVMLTCLSDVAAGAPPKRIQVVVVDHEGLPISSDIMVEENDRWTRLGRTDQRGTFEHPYKCRTGVRFMAKPRDRTFYDSAAEACSAGRPIRLTVAPKSTPVLAGGGPIVGGAPMYPTRTIVENARNSRDHTTLVSAVQAAGLADTLGGAGPFTVFAPSNDAFAKLPAGTVDTLLQPSGRQGLTDVLTYHIVPGRITTAQMAADIRAGGGRARYTTASGSILQATMSGKDVILTDSRGGQSRVTQADVGQSNGIIHVVDNVLLPRG